MDAQEKAGDLLLIFLSEGRMGSLMSRPAETKENKSGSSELLKLLSGLER